MAIPTLEDIKETYKKLAVAGAPEDTGRLKKSIATSYKKLSDVQYRLDLNMVSYGLWWNDPPPVVKRKKLAQRREFNFANRAANHPDLAAQIFEYTKADIDAVVTQKMQDAFAKGGYSKLRQAFKK